MFQRCVNFPTLLRFFKHAAKSVILGSQCSDSHPAVAKGRKTLALRRAAGEPVHLLDPLLLLSDGTRGTADGFRTDGRLPSRWAVPCTVRRLNA